MDLFRVRNGQMDVCAFCFSFLFRTSSHLSLHSQRPNLAHEFAQELVGAHKHGKVAAAIDRNKFLARRLDRCEWYSRAISALGSPMLRVRLRQRVLPATTCFAHD
jgi:hypothetical protein